MWTSPENYIFSVVSVGGHLDVGDCGFGPCPAVLADGLGWLVVVDHRTSFFEDNGRRRWMGVVVRGFLRTNLRAAPSSQAAASSPLIPPISLFIANNPWCHPPPLPSFIIRHHLPDQCVGFSIQQQEWMLCDILNIFCSTIFKPIFMRLNSGHHSQWLLVTLGTLFCEKFVQSSFFRSF